jgi:4-hydroxy-2-oxoglutarate aldolase
VYVEAATLERAMLIDGIHVPLTTPFERDGRVALGKLAGNVGRYSLSPVAGLVAMGPGGEAGSLSDEEIAEVLRVVGEAADAEKVLVAGIAKDSVRGALTVAELASAAGFDAVLVKAPRDWAELAVGEVGLFFKAVADGSPLPVVLWSDGAAGEMELPVAMVAELARHRNVIGVVDAGLDLGRYEEIAKATAGVKREVAVTSVFAPVTRRMSAGVDGSFVPLGSLSGGVVVAPVKTGLKTRVKVVGFQVMAAGGCGELLPLLQAGVGGAVPRLGACAPQGCYEVYAAFKDGDEALSAEKAERVREADEVMRELGVAGVKYGCDWNGYYGGMARLPRLGLTGAARKRVEGLLGGVRN